MKTVMSFRVLFFLGALISLVFFLATYILQYGFKLEPCPLCYLQRAVLFSVLCLFCLAALQNAKKDGRLIYCTLIFILSILGSVLAARQLWLQYISPANESNCFAGFEKMLEFMPLWEVIKESFRGTQDCSKIDFTFLSLSLSAWSLLSFISLAGFSVFISWLHLTKRRI